MGYPIKNYTTIKLDHYILSLILICNFIIKHAIITLLSKLTKFKKKGFNPKLNNLEDYFLFIFTRVGATINLGTPRLYSILYTSKTLQ